MGSTRKLKKQKGTGGARSGSILSPLFPGGGRVFGPVPRDYSFKLNKKLKQLARKSALTYKAKDNAITVVKTSLWRLPKPRFIAITKTSSSTAKQDSGGAPETNPVVSLSARNLQNVKVIPASNLNTYDVMNAAGIVLAETSVEPLTKCSDCNHSKKSDILIKPILTERMTAQGDKAEPLRFSSWIRGPISWKSRRPSKRCTGWS